MFPRRSQSLTRDSDLVARLARSVYVNRAVIHLSLLAMASWDPEEEMVFRPDLTSRTRDKSLHFTSLGPHPETTAGLKHAVVSVSAALADTVSEVQRLTSANEEAARTSGRFSQQVSGLQEDLIEVTSKTPTPITSSKPDLSVYLYSSLDDASANHKILVEANDNASCHALPQPRDCNLPRTQ